MCGRPYQPSWAARAYSQSLSSSDSASRWTPGTSLGFGFLKTLRAGERCRVDGAGSGKHPFPRAQDVPSPVGSSESGPVSLCPRVPSLEGWEQRLHACHSPWLLLGLPTRGQSMTLVICIHPLGTGLRPPVSCQLISRYNCWMGMNFSCCSLSQVECALRTHRGKAWMLLSWSTEPASPQSTHGHCAQSGLGCTQCL